MDIETIIDFVKDFMSHSGHPYSHVNRVYLLCKKTAELDSSINKSVLFPAALLHDIARASQLGTKIESKDVKKIIGYKDSDFMKHHSEIGARWAYNYLQSINYPNDLSEQISYCILNHSYDKNVIPKTIEARVLQESDRIDAMGAIGIIRTSVHNSTMHAYHPTDPLARNREVDDWKYGLDHFSFKLLKLKDTITIDSLKPFVNKRHDYMISFLEKVEDEVLNNNCEGPANFMIKFMRSNPEMKHYNDNFPFNPANDTIVGNLVQKKDDAFIKDFLEQLKTEIL